MSSVVAIALCLIAAGAGVVYLKYGTLDPCGVVRAQIRQEASRAGGFGAAVAAMLPDSAIDGLIAAQYGAPTPGRCVSLMLNPSPGAQSARRALSIQ